MRRARELVLVPGEYGVVLRPEFYALYSTILIHHERAARACTRGARSRYTSHIVRCLPRPVRVGVPVRHRRFAPRKHAPRPRRLRGTPLSTFTRLHTTSSRHRGSTRTTRGGAAAQPRHRRPPPRSRRPEPLNRACRKPGQSTTRRSRSFAPAPLAPVGRPSPRRHHVESPTRMQLSHARLRSWALW